jgi:hypothetical protein
MWTLDQWKGAEVGIREYKNHAEESVPGKSSLFEKSGNNYFEIE